MENLEKVPKEEKCDCNCNIKDFTGDYEIEVVRLSEFVNKLPDEIKKIFPSIEIRKNAKESHSLEEIAKIIETRPNFNPDESAGEYHDGKIKLYEYLFKALAKEKEKFRIKRSREILLHEFGHYAYSYFLDKKLMDRDEWDKARKTDKENTLDDYKGALIQKEDEREEDFAESFGHFLSNKEKFEVDFPNRYLFCKKLTKTLSESKDF